MSNQKFDLIFISTSTETWVQGAKKWPMIPQFYVNGEPLAKTAVDDVYKLPRLGVPLVLEVLVPEKRNLLSFKLKDGFPESAKTPAHVPKEFFDYDQTLEMRMNSDIAGLYEEVVEIIPAHLEPVEFEHVLLNEDDDFQVIEPAFPVEHALLDQLRFSRAQLTHKPTLLDGKLLFKLIREKVKSIANDGKFKITSDYDFHFAVGKVVQLDRPVERKREVGAGRKKRAEIFFQKERTVEVINIAPPGETRWGAVPLKSIYARDYMTVKKMVDEYLEELVNMLLTPMRDCEHCHGLGVKGVNVPSLPSLEN